MIQFSAIGQANTEFKQIENVPIQGAGISDATGSITLFDEFATGLQDIEGFSHLYILFHLHRSAGSALKVTPFLDTQQHGIFATRSPKRPNPLGLSIVELVKRQGSTLHVRGIDLLDGTPILDIKPYIQSFDRIDNTKDGWYEQGIIPQGVVSDGRFK